MKLLNSGLFLNLVVGAFVMATTASALAAPSMSCSTSVGNFGYQRRTVIGNGAHFSQPALIISEESEKAYFRASDNVSIEGFCFLQGYKKGVISQSLPLHPSFTTMIVAVDAQGELLDLSLSRANLEGAIVTAITCRERR